MKKLWIAIILIVAIGIAAWLAINESRPQGDPGEYAETLATNMLQAVGAEEWNAIPMVGWTFRESNHYVWDKRKHISQVKWDDYEVVIDLNDQTGEARKGAELLEGEKGQAALQDAWARWCNDSFWLNAPAKVMDAGTKRTYIKLDDGYEGLLVEYTSGGVTPGDAYLWALDENHMPVYYKLWVSSIPVGGLRATWDDWVTIDGARIAMSHQLGPENILISNLKTGSLPSDFGLPSDYFSRWAKN